MGERVVKIRLSAEIAQFKKDFEEASQKTRELGTESEKLAQKKQAFQQLGAASLAMGVTIGAGVGLAVSKFMDFDQAMSNVAATGQDATDNLGALRQAAIDAGASTVFSATEAANAIEEMAKAGVDAKDILGGGLSGALDLAAAGGLGVADAAGIAATALKIFGLRGEDMSHVADLLAAGAGKAMGDVSDLSQALAQGGQVAASTGLSIEETTAALAAFASEGLLGSDAGTSFKTMLQRLTPQSQQAADKMKELGISAYDAQGNFIGLEKFAGNLQQSMKDLTPEQRNAAMAIIFGSDSVRAANVLYKEGAKGIAEWTDKVNDTGYAAETARKRLDNLKGDWEGLMGALDSAFINAGEAANGPLRDFVQAITDMVDGFNSLPAGAQQATLAVGAVASAGAIALGSYLLLVPKMAEFNEALKSLSPSAATFAGKMASVAKYAGVAAGIATTLVVGAEALSNWAYEAYGVDNAVAAATTTNKSFLKSMEDARSVTVASADRIREALDNISAGNVFGDAGNKVFELQDGLSKMSQGLKDIPIADALAKVRSWGDELKLSDDQMKVFISQIPGFTEMVRKHLSTTGEAADDQAVWNAVMDAAPAPTQKQKKSLEDLQGVATEVTQDVNDLADAIRNFGSQQFDTERATVDFYKSFADLKKILDDGKGSLDVTTEAGRDTTTAILDGAQATNDYAAAVAAMGGTTEQIQGVLDDGRQRIIDTRIALGDSEEAARAYADRLIATPATVKTQVLLNGVEDADLKLGDFIRNWDGRRIRVGVDTYGGLTYQLPGANVKFNANGGMYAYASGGIGEGMYSGGTPLYKFAEPETKWEAFISGRDSARSRNIGVWQEAGRRLGVGPTDFGGMSLNGLGISGTLEIGGDGLARIVDGRITAYDKSQKKAAQRGWDGSF